jgi:hypothetical protein
MEAIMEGRNPTISLVKFHEAMDKLANDTDYYERIRNDPNLLSQDLNVPDLYYKGEEQEFPSQDKFKDAYAKLGPEKGRALMRPVPLQTAIIAMLGGSTWGPPPPKK